MRHPALLMLAGLVCLAAGAIGLAPDTEHGPLPNLRTASQGVLSGGEPAGDAAFDELARLGVRTIISVDGARPDLHRARTRNIQYVHVPLTYHDITLEQQLQIARALRDSAGPVYVHCHHGRHRGPAGVAAALVRLDRFSNDEALAFLETAGTSPRYAGLFASVRQAEPVDASAIDETAPAPEVARVTDLVGAMAELDRRYWHLDASRRAGWTTPADHPDLVPLAEAARIADLFRELRDRKDEIGDPRSIAGDDPNREAKSREFWALMGAAIEQAAALEDLLAADQPSHENAGQALDRLGNLCFTCHVSYQ